MVSLDIDRLRAWCEARGVPNQPSDAGGLAIGVAGSEPILATPYPDRGMLMLACAYPFVVAEGDREEYARAVGLLNSSSLMGAFVMHSATGETYFRLSVPLAGATFDDAAVEFLLRVVAGSVANTREKLASVALGGQPYNTVL